MSKLEKVRLSLRSRIDQVRRKPLWIAGIAAAVLVVGIGVYVAVAGTPKWAPAIAVSNPLAKPTVAELVERTKRDPSDAESHLQLGHAYFETKRRAQAVREYERALVQDRGLADEELLGNLVSCFGTAEQGEAASLITRFKLVADRAEARRPREGRPLQRPLGRAPDAREARQGLARGLRERVDRDLDSEKCELRQAAVVNLGNEGDKRALAAIREAKKKDQQKPGWFGATCLGGRPDEAEKKLLAAK